MNSSVQKVILVFFLTLRSILAFAQEPTNYPTAFAATVQGGTSIQLTWTGSTGANLPTNYLILVRVVPVGAFAVPADGNGVSDDADLTDNLGAKNVVHAVGANSYTWSGLPIDTDFEFIIYPYKTGGAPTPDFKTDAGGGLTATASTKRPTVTSPTVSGIGDVGATLGGTVTSNGGNTLTERGTLWKTSAGVTIADNKLAEGGTGVSTFTSARVGLPPGSHIFYAAYSTNIAGSSLSSESSFYTFSTVPDNQPASVTATAVSATQINLTFTSITSNGANTNGYIILRSVGSDPLTSSVQDGVAPASLALGASTLVATISATSTTTYNDTGLADDTDYHYAVVPFNWNTTNPETYNYKVGAGFTIANATTDSKSSDIIYTGGSSLALNYRNSNVQLPTINDTDLAKSYRLATFQLRDGGGSSDADNKPTSITSITVQITKPANIRQIALFNDDTSIEIPGTEQAMPGSGTVVFNPSSPIRNTSDGVALNFMVRVTFNAAVTDNDAMVVTISSVTGENGYSGFAAANAGGANSSANPNKTILVTASKLILQPLATPNPSPIATNFSLTVKAVDANPFNNIDADYIGKVDLTITGGAGTLTGGAQSLSPSLVAGQFAWNQLKISAAGSYTLNVSDDAYTDPPESQTDIGDPSGGIVITSASANITQPSALNLCFGGTPQTLGNIVITETDASGFSSGGTFSLSLPAGFIFDQSVTTAPILAGGSDISGASALSYPGSNIVQFSYSVSGTANTNSITIAGLKISAPHPGTTSPSAIVGDIIRSGGTASIAGDISGTIHGDVHASLGTAPVGLGFTVAKVNVSDIDVDPNETRFSQGSNAVRLVGSHSSPPYTGTFSGSGVTFVSSEYRFNPSSLSPGTYPISYLVKDGSGCEFVVQKTFEVYVTNITGLALQYCNNSTASPTLSVSASYITSRYGASFTFQKFVYWNTPTFTPIDITAPSVNVFDPKQAIYQPVYASTASVYGTSGIWIGFTVTDGLYTYTEWQLIHVNAAQKPSFTFSHLPNFCADELPVTLTGVPPNSNTIGDDFFTATAGQTASITNGGSPVVWSFNPSAVTGVSVGTPVTFNVTYTYRDPATGCSGTSDPQSITVSARPGTVTAAAITSGISQQICQGAAVGSFTASMPAGTNYKWYTDSPPTNQLGTGNTFTPSVNTAIAATTNFYVTQVINGCESNKQPSSPTPPLQLSVIVNASPGKPVADFIRSYCVNQSIPNSDLQVTGSNIKWYKLGNPVSIFSGSNPTATNLGITNLVAGIYDFEVTETISGCEGVLSPTKVNVTVKALPIVSIKDDATDLSKVCKTGSLINFAASDQAVIPATSAANGTWSGTASSALTGTNPAFGTTVLNPSLLNPGLYKLRYTYTNPTSSCSNFSEVAVTILPTIVPGLTIGTACENAPVTFTNTSVMNPPTSGTSPSYIASTSWNFGDGDVVTAGTGPIVFPDDHAGRTSGTYSSPNHTYSKAITYQLNYQMTTSDGCVIAPATQLLVINPKPKIKFSWTNVCRDVTSSTQFNAVEMTTPAALPIQNYNWNFNINNTLSYSAAGTGSNPVVQYNIDGKDSVQLIVTTNAQCRDTTKLPVYIVPSFPTLLENNSYNQDFNAGTDGWIAGGLNSSWAHGKPIGTINKDASIAGLGNAWDTNLSGLSNTKEQSWVLSPCFDFTATTKPIISLDIWSDTPSGNDGAVLQYIDSSTGNILDDADWTTIGLQGQGANWYDESGISSSPGNQSANDIGWTGIYGGWRRAAYKLDNLKGKSNIVFRIAFASNSPRRDGFAFDNVFIGERSRTLLVESFTNSSSTAATKPHNDKFASFATSTEIARIQFNTAFPAPDPLNEANAAINNSRAAFYGITNAPVFAVDGTVVKGVEFQKTFDDRLLTPSALRIDINAVKDDELVRINTIITNTTNQIISANGINVFTAIVEKSVTESDFLGDGGDSEFHFVAKEMLPSAAGVRMTQDIAPLANLVMPEVVWKNRNLIDINNGNASIVVFVQSIEGGNKNVLQAKMIDAAVEPDAVTGTEPSAMGQFTAYPNPSQDVLNIRLPHVPTKAIPVTIIDGFGREVYSNSFTIGEREKSITTSEFASGIYIIQINAPSAGVVRKKIIIAH